MRRMENPNVGRQKWPVFLAALTRMAKGERLGKNGRLTMAATSAGQCPTQHISYQSRNIYFYNCSCTCKKNGKPTCMSTLMACEREHKKLSSQNEFFVKLFYGEAVRHLSLRILAALTRMARGERLGRHGPMTMDATSAGQCPTQHISYQEIIFFYNCSCTCKKNGKPTCMSTLMACDREHNNFHRATNNFNHLFQAP